MKKTTVHILLSGVYCLLAAVALCMDFKLFTGNVTTRPLIFYTILSNMLCSGFMLISFIKGIRNQESVCTVAPLCKFLFMVMILLTALVHNLLLEYHSSLFSYFADVKNALHHLILPVMFFLDWLFFYPRRSIKPWQPLLVPVIPLLYVCYILLRAAYVRQAGISVGVLYPYFFLNVESLGWSEFGVWMGILLAVLLALGYGLYGIDRLLRPGKKCNG